VTDEPSRFTPETRTAYTARVDELIAALRSHADLVLTLDASTVDDPAREASVLRLREAAETFDDAEWDWCGRYPLDVEYVEDDEDDDEDDDEEDELDDEDE
jgi:hypothetical protein